MPNGARAFSGHRSERGRADGSSFVVVPVFVEEDQAVTPGACALTVRFPFVTRLAHVLALGSQASRFF